MEERLEERERIASDLHDTLLQSVQGLILKFHAVSKQIPADMPAHHALEKTLDHADEVLAEGRDSIRNLRVNFASLSDLPAAFRSVAEETSQGRDAIFKTVVEGRVRDLHPVVLEECYCIGREAIINALSIRMVNTSKQKSDMTRESFVCACVTMDEASILRSSKRAGVPVIGDCRECTSGLKKIGGQLKFWSRPETGTEVELTVPAATAYGNSSQKTKKFQFRFR